MSKALYRKYRSKSLSEVVGQGHITDILSRSIKSGRIAHAYLFTGPRGVGKTSIARILAHEINDLPYAEDEQHLDIIEIDAASNNGVEDIRDLREKVQLAPIKAKKKVYIIDEVHMLSKAAFNALLKTLEEPPEHIVFILATTDADKLPDTIVSRTQRFNFRTIAPAEVAAHLKWITEQEGFSAEPEALQLIAVHGGGSFRDSIGLLDQLHGAAAKKEGITKGLVESFLGLPSAELVDKLLKSYMSQDATTTIHLLNEAEKSGGQPAVIATELIRRIKDAAAEHPHLIPLLDSLIEVGSSSRPDIKLLTALASFPPHIAPVKPPKQKSVALSAPKVPEITLQPAKDTPQPPVVSEITQAEKPQVPQPAPITAPSDPVDFDWEKVLSHTKTNYIALFSVLSKCTPSLSGATLTLYTGNGFYKKKLDDSRYRGNIIEALRALGMNDVTIETVDSQAPPKDAVAASVAALMGGGEEYAIEEGEGSQE